MALLYFLNITYDIFVNNIKKVSEKKEGLIKKIKSFLCQSIKCLIISIFLLTLINIPLLWVSAITFNIQVKPTFLMSLILLYITEMFMMFSFGFSENIGKGKKQISEPGEKDAQKMRLGTKMFLVILFVIFMVAGLYKYGMESASQKQSFEVINNSDFIIAYKYEDNCILLSTEIDNSSITINKNKQKIVDINDIEYEIISFAEIEVK